MRAWFSTLKTQGHRNNDFSFVPEGELVYPSMVCDRDERAPDNNCGCARSVGGLVCHKATTTFVIGEFDGDLVKEIKKSLVDAGYNNDFVKKYAPEIAEQIFAVSALHPVGTVMERRGEDVFQARRLK